MTQKASLRSHLARFWIAYPVALLALAVVGYVAYWFWLAHQIDAGIDDWIAEERTAGREVLIGARDMTGFPMAMRIVLEDLRYDDPKHVRRVHIPGLVAEVSPFDLKRIVGRAEGTIAVDLGRGPAPGRYNVTMADNALRYDVSNGGALFVDLQGVEIAGPPAVPHIAAKTLNVRLSRNRLPVYGSLTLDATDVVLPRELATPLGDRVRYFKTDIDLKGGPPPDAITPEALDRWRRDGGDVEFRSLAFGHGDADVRAKGTLALDGDLQPIAAFTAKISGFKETVDALIAAGMVRPREGAMAKAVLGFLASTPKNGGRAEFGAAVTVQDRILSVGPVSLMRLPAVRWD